MKPEIKPTGLQGEGPPDETIGKPNALFVTVFSVLILIALSALVIWWLLRT